MYNECPTSTVLSSSLLTQVYSIHSMYMCIPSGVKRDCNYRRRLPLQSEQQTINATNFNNNRSLMLHGEGRDELRLDVV